MRLILSISGLIFCTLSIAQNNPIGITYHNVTARYNGYFIAKEQIKEIEQTIFDRYEWDYNHILPVFPQFDTTTSRSLETQLQDCIEKASIAIQRHPESRWEDDAYILVGKARLYGSEFPEAIETFKWVNTNGDDINDQHRALINLLRTFTEAKEYKNARAVLEYLDKQEINVENKKQLHLNKAYFHHVMEEYDLMVQNLVEAEEMMNRGADKARVDFIIGQVYQALNFDANAYSYYKRALKQSNTYELSFFTKLNMAQVTQMTSNSNIKKVRKYFRKLLNDPKNLEYQDRIYFEMGQFDFKRGDLAGAIENYKLSVASGKDNRQKAYSFLKIGQIYYDSLRNFQLAKNYYDSTIQVLPKDEENYEEIKSRQEILSEFVEHYTTLQTNDSLISLSKLSDDSLEVLLNLKLDEMELAYINEQEAEKKRKRKEKLTETNINSFDEENLVTINESISGTWYFYNTSEISRGQAEFTRIWGNVELTDNWRRSTRNEIRETEPQVQELAAVQDPAAGKETSKEETEFDREGERSRLVAQIPTSESQLEQLLGEIEVAYYELGNIYNFKLNEKQNAISSFNSLLLRFDSSEYRPEVLYQLYLLYQPMDSTQSDKTARQLLAEFPESIYAKLIFNPNYIEESKALLEAYKKVYKEAYLLYDNGDYQKSLNQIDSALINNPQNQFTDNLMLLKAMNLGKIDGIYKYQYELNNFIRNNPDSELLDYAKVLVKASEDFQINLYSSSRAKFIKNFDDRHYFILLYSPKPELSKSLPEIVQTFIEENSLDLNTGNLVFDEGHAMVLVNEFDGKATANDFIKLFDSGVDLLSEFKGEKFYPLIITRENFEIFYETKDLDSYLTFYQKNYP